MQSEENGKNGEEAKKAGAAAQDNVVVQGTLGGQSDDEKTKMSKKQIIGMVVLSLIAIGGVLFGVYGMNSQNEQIAQLTVRATDAEGKVAQLETGKITITNSDGSTTEITDSATMRQNPVIVSDDSSVGYRIRFDSPTVYGNAEANSIEITVENGEVVGCSINRKQNSSDDSYVGFTSTKLSDCNIVGVSGKIYKVVDFWSGQMMTDDNIGFILEDGTVEYFKFSDAIADNNISVKKLDIGGFVVDAFDVDVSDKNPPYGGGISTIFILGNGTFVRFNDSMLD